MITKIPLILHYTFFFISQGTYPFVFSFQMNCDKNHNNQDNEAPKETKETKAPKETKYSCPNVGCQKEFTYRSERSRHKKVCQYAEPEKLFENVDGGFKCLRCSKIVKHSNNLKRHGNKCNEKRDKVNTHECPQCHKVFAYKSKLVEHSKVHNRISYECHACHNIFKREDHMRKHKCEPQVAVSAVKDEPDDFELPSMALRGSNPAYENTAEDEAGDIIFGGLEAEG